LWSIHPKYLDRAGLLAVWREALLAEKVLEGKTRGHTNHPQLIRFKSHPLPEEAIANYLLGIWEESKRRSYSFDRKKIAKKGRVDRIPVTRGQLKNEFRLLQERLKGRAPRVAQELACVREIESHPLFESVEGTIEEWEKTTPQ
jgi:hypothetical protein